jgi:signal transduction histidine kinase/ActR/RegA family two-component response regulator
MHELEHEFLSEFRRAGVRSAYMAGIAAVTIFLVMVFISLSGAESIGRINLIRLAIASVISLTMLALYTAVKRDFFYVVPILAFGSFCALFGTVIIARLAEEGGMEVVLSIPVALNFGLFLHYCFLRLPLVVSGCIGWSVAISVLVLAPSVLAGNWVRHAVYLAFANVFGMILCRLIEKRERELFYQRRNAEAGWAEARKMQREAEESVEEKNRLIAAVGHDLRQPITAASLHMEVMGRRLVAKDLEGALKQSLKAQEALGTLGGTLEHLLTSARYDIGVEPISAEWIDLSATLGPLLDSFALQADRMGVEFRIRGPRTPVQMHTDRKSFERIVSNLLDNALKFSRPFRERRAAVLCGVRLTAGAVLIEIVDTGPGISAQDQSRVWEPYSRLEQDGGDRQGGLGLGLFLVRRLSEQLPDHQVLLRSVPGKGTRFVLRVPARYAHEEALFTAEATPDLTGPDASILWGSFVVLIEDDRQARESMVQALSEWGVMVVAASGVQQLEVELTESERLVDAIVSDYHLPAGRSGLDAIETLRQTLGYSPHAIVVTGETDMSSITARVGRDTIVLQKPLSGALLKASLVRAVAASAEMTRA